MARPNRPQSVRAESERRIDHMSRFENINRQFLQVRDENPVRITSTYQVPFAHEDNMHILHGLIFIPSTEVIHYTGSESVRTKDVKQRTNTFSLMLI